MDLMRDLVATIAGDPSAHYLCLSLSADPGWGPGQPHLHLLISGRQDDGIARAPTQHFRRYNRTHPERGGAPKDPALHHRAVKGWRVTISDVINVHLERVGLAERLHPDRLADRDITRQPQPKLLPSQSRTYREKGSSARRWRRCLTIRAERQQTWATEQANARAYWEERKLVLGITEAMDLPAQLAAIGTARALVGTRRLPSA